MVNLFIQIYFVALHIISQIISNCFTVLIFPSGVDLRPVAQNIYSLGDVPMSLPIIAQGSTLDIRI